MTGPWAPTANPEHPGRLTLSAHGKPVSIGAFLTPAERREVAETPRVALWPDSAKWSPIIGPARSSHGPLDDGRRHACWPPGESYEIAVNPSTSFMLYRPGGLPRAHSAARTAPWA